MFDGYDIDFDVDKPLTEEDMRNCIKLNSFLEVLEETSEGFLVFDGAAMKEFPIHFLEKMNENRLSEMIFISPKIHPQFEIDKDFLADYLWNACDKNIFATLREIVFMWDVYDTSDPEHDRLYKKYIGDDELEFYDDDDLCELYTEVNNIAIIDVHTLVDISCEIALQDVGPNFSATDLKNIFLDVLLEAVICDLREIQLDRNIFVPEGFDTSYLDNECALHKYCRGILENNEVPHDILVRHQGSSRKPSLDDTIKSASSRTCKPYYFPYIDPFTR